MRYPTLILSVVCMVFTAGTASAEKRVAFVVGNGAYKNVAPLPNPSVDRPTAEEESWPDTFAELGQSVAADTKSTIERPVGS